MVHYKSSSSSALLENLLNALTIPAYSSSRRSRALVSSGIIPTTGTSEETRGGGSWRTATVGLSLAVLYVVGQVFLRDKDDRGCYDSSNQSWDAWYALCGQKFKETLLRRCGRSSDKKEGSFDEPEDEKEDRTPMTHQGSCHCNAVTFELTAPRTLHVREGGTGKIRYDRARVRASSFHLVRGEQHLQTYHVEDKRGVTTAHSFCDTCGVHILHAAVVPTGADRKTTTLYVNVQCLESGWKRKIVKAKEDHRNVVAPKGNADNKKPPLAPTPRKKGQCANVSNVSGSGAPAKQAGNNRPESSTKDGNDITKSGVPGAIDWPSGSTTRENATPVTPVNASSVPTCDNASTSGWISHDGDVASQSELSQSSSYSLDGAFPTTIVSGNNAGAAAIANGSHIPSQAKLRMFLGKHLKASAETTANTNTTASVGTTEEEEDDDEEIMAGNGGISFEENDSFDDDVVANGGCDPCHALEEAEVF